MPRPSNRSFAPRKARQWVGFHGEFTVELNNRSDVPAVTNFVLSVENLDMISFLDREASGKPITASRAVTFGASHWVIAGDERQTLGTVSNICPAAVMFGVGIQGGVGLDATQLPKLLDNANSGMWPVVGPVHPRSAPQPYGTSSNQQSDQIVTYGAEISSRGQRKVQPGQSIIASLAIRYPSRITTGAVKPTFEFGILGRVLFLL